MTKEAWQAEWWNLYRAYVAAGKEPAAAFQLAHDRMLRVFGPEPKGPEKAGPPFWLKLLAPLAGVSMDFFTKIWDWLNGKKTIVGAIITAAAVIATYIPGLLAFFGVADVKIAAIIGVATTVVGLLHKLYKFIYGEEHP